MLVKLLQKQYVVSQSISQILDQTIYQDHALGRDQIGLGIGVARCVSFSFKQYFKAFNARRVNKGIKYYKGQRRRHRINPDKSRLYPKGTNISRYRPLAGQLFAQWLHSAAVLHGFPAPRKKKKEVEQKRFTLNHSTPRECNSELSHLLPTSLIRGRPLCRRTGSD